MGTRIRAHKQKTHRFHSFVPSFPFLFVLNVEPLQLKSLSVSSTVMTNGSSLIVDVHYNGVFSPNPLVYFDPDIASVRDVYFNAMVFSDFITFLEKLTKKINFKDVYYCIPHERLSEGLGVSQNEGDYREFLEVGNGSQEKRINVYIDQYNEPIFDWIEEENPDEYDSVVEDEDEVDESTFSYAILPDHEDDEVVSSKKPLDDSFLNALCPNKKSEDSSDTDATDEEVDVKPMYPVHDPNQNWKKMVPILGIVRSCERKDSRS
ncbi:unnamed protein product [Lactuca virosa]|uniref:Uncharacterized protein n=1 Tax=Lactuca virosa TaxID=75947 RepID=A0AAU9NDV3_9ASTR|nr:unnamed protein product [Lactuca virosa]